MHFIFWHIIQAVVATMALGIACRFYFLFNPFLQKDKEEGRITREKAVELLECLWVKIESISCIRSDLGFPFQHISERAKMQVMSLGNTWTPKARPPGPTAG